MEYKRRGVKLSYLQGLSNVLARIIAEAPPAGTRTRLDRRRACQYLKEEGIADPKEQARMVKLCMKRVKRLAKRRASVPTSGTTGDDKTNGKERIAREAHASVRAMLLKAEAQLTTKALHATARIPALGDVIYVDLDGYGQASEATVVDEEHGEIYAKFVADDVEHRYPVDDIDIIRVIEGAPQGSDAKRKREEHTVEASKRGIRGGKTQRCHIGKAGGRENYCSTACFRRFKWCQGAVWLWYTEPMSDIRDVCIRSRLGGSPNGTRWQAGPAFYMF